MKAEFVNFLRCHRRAKRIKETELLNTGRRGLDKNECELKRWTSVHKRWMKTEKERADYYLKK